MTVKKLTVENLKAMVKEAVALQMKQSASERQAKIEADKKKSEEKKVNESKSVKVTLEQLRHLVKEAVQAKLKENFDGGAAIGDMVSFNGKTAYVGDTKMGPDGSMMVGLTRDGLRMNWVPAAAVQVMASSDELDELSPEEMGSIDSEMGMGLNADPGEDPQAEFDRVSGQLDSKLLAKPTRAALGKRAGDLKTKLGLGDDSY